MFRFQSLCNSSLKYFCLSLAFLACTGYPEAKVLNVDEIKRAMGVEALERTPRSDNLKIAVLDLAFQGAEKEGVYLPLSAELVEKYPADFIQKYDLGSTEEDLQTGFADLGAASNHGRYIAQAVWSITGNSPNGPKFYLLNTNGITNFKRAVRYAIEKEVDVIVHSQNWEYFGDFDGTGFINEIVRQATREGILWINAAGNYGGAVFNTVIGEITEGWVKLGDRYNLRLQSHLDENPVKISLAWTGTTNDPRDGTDKDLDLYLQNEKNEPVATATKTQISEATFKQKGQSSKENGQEGQSLFARETFNTTLSKGNYSLFVHKKATSKKFSPNDRLRVTVLPSKPPIFFPDRNENVRTVELLDASATGSIMVPADHPDVVTVGVREKFGSVGPTTDGRQKPDIFLPTGFINLTSGDNQNGTSFAAAYVAGAALLLKAQNPSLSRADLISHFQKLSQQVNSTPHFPPVVNSNPALPVETPAGQYSSERSSYFWKMR